MKSTFAWPFTIAVFFALGSVTHAGVQINSTLACSALSNSREERGPFTSALPFTLSGNTLKGERKPGHLRPGEESYRGTISSNKAIELTGRGAFFDGSRPKWRYQFSGSINNESLTRIKGSLESNFGAHRDCSITFELPPARWAAILAPPTSAPPEAQNAPAQSPISIGQDTDSSKGDNQPKKQQADPEPPVSPQSADVVAGRNAKQRLDDPSSGVAAATQSGPSSVPTVISTPPIAEANTVSADRRIALIIGNGQYANVARLANPEHDANSVAKLLNEVGFQSVTLQTNLTKDALTNALHSFAIEAERADWAVLYYSGHGMEVSGVNYLIPIDARIAVDRDIEFEAVRLDQVLNAIERSKKLHLVILDACRNNPFKNQMQRTLTLATRSVSQGLAAVEPDAGTLVEFAAKDGETALDGNDANSPFALALLKNLPTPGLEVRRLFDYVRDDVMEMTGRKQKPFSYGSISGRQDFYFVSAK